MREIKRSRGSFKTSVLSNLLFAAIGRKNARAFAKPTELCKGSVFKNKLPVRTGPADFYPKGLAAEPARVSGVSELVAGLESMCVYLRQKVCELNELTRIIEILWVQFMKIRVN
jgi:hypothetical protein